MKKGSYFIRDSFNLSHPPKFVMKLGMILQVMFGCLTGQVPFVFHCLLRTADAACCVLMYGGGGMICKKRYDR